MAELFCTGVGQSLTTSDFSQWSSATIPNEQDLEVTQVYIDALVATPNVRAGLYLGGVSDVDPSGASLLWDIGEINSGNKTIVAPGGLSLTASSRVWLVIRGPNPSSGVVRASSSNTCPTLRQAAVRSQFVDRADSTTPMPATATTGTYTGGVPYISAVLTYESVTPVGPVYVGPDPIEFKIGEDIGTVDMEAWFSSTGTISSVAATGLPAGITDNGDNTLTGTATAAGTTDTELTAIDNIAQTVTNVPWFVYPYQINYSGINRLEDGAGAVLTSTDFNYSVFAGAIASLTASDTPILEAATQAVANGVLQITLPDSETAVADYSVAIEVLDVPDDASGTPVVPIAILPATST